MIIDYAIASPRIRQFLNRRERKLVTSQEAPLDEDVARERSRVLSGGADNDVIAIKVPSYPSIGSVGRTIGRCVLFHTVFCLTGGKLPVFCFPSDILLLTHDLARVLTVVV